MKEESKSSTSATVIWSALLLSSTAFSVILWANPDYLAHGAWRGYYDQTGDSSLIEIDGDDVWLLGESGERTFNVANGDIDLTSLRTRGGPFSAVAMSNPYYEQGNPVDLWHSADSPMFGVNRALVLDVAGDVRVIPLTHIGPNLILNDEVGGVPVLVVISQRTGFYCVFERQIGETAHTFGSSGYMYYENGVLDGNFELVLWDAESRSLWWSPIGEAIAGPMQGMKLKVLEHALWSHATMPEVFEAYESIKIIRDGATAIEADYTPVDFTIPTVLIEPSDRPLLARWGENPLDKSGGASSGERVDPITHP